MIRAMNLEEIMPVTGGRLLGGNAWFSAVSIDTRTLQPDDLFVAIEGERFNGNEFVAEAAAKRAAAAIVTEEIEAELPLLLVDDSRIALGRLGALNRDACEACVIALTGSQGKTTVKEMLAAILSGCGDVLATQGNLNNDYGVPLTLLRIDGGHDFAVLELGANAPGEIAYTASLVRPAIAHITNVAPTHLEGFGDIDGVNRTKSEIWDSIIEGGTAVINLDDNYAGSWLAKNAGKKIVTISAAGNRDADYRVADLRFGADPAAEFTLETPRGSTAIAMKFTGRHNVANALAAAALAVEAGAAPEHVKSGLAALEPVAGRLFHCRGRSGSVIIDDSYNASPASFRAAIDVLAARPGKRFLAMGDMGELGDDSRRAHEAVGEYAAAAGIDALYAIGPLSALAAERFGENAQIFSSLGVMEEAIARTLGENVTVLVKGSRSAGMEALVQRLIDEEG